MSRDLRHLRLVFLLSMATLLAAPSVAGAIPIRSFLIDYNRPQLWFAAQLVPINGPTCGGAATAFLTVKQLRPLRLLRDRVMVYHGPGCRRFDGGQAEGRVFVGRLNPARRYRACLEAFQVFVDSRGRSRVSGHSACRTFRP